MNKLESAFLIAAFLCVLPSSSAQDCVHCAPQNCDSQSVSSAGWNLERWSLYREDSLSAEEDSPCAATLGSSATTAQAASQNPANESTEDLQKATQNPVASLISVPFQNNTDLNIGPFARDKNTLNIQPVIPSGLTRRWNLITRIIVPVIYQPDLSSSDPRSVQAHLGTFGLGDIQPTFFFSPAKPSKMIWGVGPSFLLPTATDDNLGTGKLSVGLSVVSLVQPGKWTIGVLVSNLWSVAGSGSRQDVNTMSLQYFVNRNLPNGYFLTSAPILSANWNAIGSGRWLVPFGGGFGRVFKLGFQPMNGSVTAYYNVIRPDSPIPSPTWQLRIQMALLFPRAPKAKM